MRDGRSIDPPSAAIARPLVAAAGHGCPAQRPKRGAPGWLAVGNAGDKNTSHAPAWQARRSSGDRMSRTGYNAGAASGRWPASRAQMHASPQLPRPAARHLPPPGPAAARGRSAPGRTPSAARAASPSWRKTTPARPRGSARDRGSWDQAAVSLSVNSQRRGKRRRLRASPRRSSFWSIAGRATAVTDCRGARLGARRASRPVP